MTVHVSCIPTCHFCLFYANVLVRDLRFGEGAISKFGFCRVKRINVEKTDFCRDDYICSVCGYNSGEEELEE